MFTGKVGDDLCDVDRFNLAFFLAEKIVLIKNIKLNLDSDEMAGNISKNKLN